MKRVMKKISLGLTCMMLMSQTVLAEEGVQVKDNPNIWASWEVQLAKSYEIGDASSYSKYQNDIIGNDFLPIEKSFESKFNVTDESKVAATDMLTRGDVIRELYDIIGQVLELSVDEMKANDELNYFKENRMILGRSSGDYALDKTCSKEEMLLFSKRVYDHLIYKLDLDSKGAFWKVSDDDNTVYLLGSVHATDGSVYPINDKAIKAFFKSDELVVEANIITPNPDNTAYVQQKMMLEGDKTIDQLLSEEVYEAYVKAVEPIGLKPEVYNKFKPWYAAMLIQNVQMAANNYTANMGIDVYFLSLALNRKPITELEGVKFQIDMFDFFTMDLQETYLESALNSEKESSELIEKILNSWKSGEVQLLEDLLFADKETTDLEKEFNSKVWDTRNSNMLEKIKAMLLEDKEKDYFVIVGAGHMLNDNGIVQGLENLGYTVEQVK